MRAWSSPDVPEVGSGSGPGPEVSVFNTATGQVEITLPQGPARMYVCGITPYDATHIGHAATYVGFDLLNRAWRDAGYDVTYVQNVTDVDDPLLERATDAGVDWRELAERETELFREDMAALRVLAPTELVGAVESMGLLEELLIQLRDRGFAYDVEGDLYFSVHSDPRFGSISRLSEGEMRELFAERGGDPDREGKKDPLDCLLWQAERPGEPAWDSAFGRGRPGWHGECAAIALRYLGESFDVQGGGSDLVFPHHEMGASEAQAAFNGLTFARSYVHAGMVALDGEKMSKSKGNLKLVSTLRDDGVDPMAIRLALLDHHYRSDWEWTDADLERAGARLTSWREAVGHVSVQQAEQLVAVVRRCLAKDLDAPAALDAVDAWAAGWHKSDGSGADLVRWLLDARLGIAL